MVFLTTAGRLCADEAGPAASPAPGAPTQPETGTAPVPSPPWPPDATTAPADTPVAAPAAPPATTPDAPPAAPPLGPPVGGDKLLATQPPEPAAKEGGAAGAGPLPSLKALIEDGVRLYNQGDYNGAIRAFTYGYALRPKPLFLFNIAQAYRKSGQDMNALAFYEKFRLADPDSPYRPETQAYIAYLRVRLGFDPAPRPAVRPLPRPVYKRSWFWVTLIGAAALTAGGIALGTVLGSDGSQTTLGTIEPRFHF
jgi:hypothetical protein